MTEKELQKLKNIKPNYISSIKVGNINNKSGEFYHFLGVNNKQDKGLSILENFIDKIEENPKNYSFEVRELGDSLLFEIGDRNTFEYLEPD
ncbi:hypothetical protein [Cetobacterium sp.]|uniref:hypothetical protein n=1 Tax=Cetobacterium sp. TaxID=2071632 RepID=UPI003F390B32